MTALTESRPQRTSSAPRAPRPAAAAAPLLGLVGLALVLVLLEVVPRTGLVNPAHLPPTSEIAVALAARVQTAAFWTALGQTLVTWLTGIVLAVGLALVLGFVIGTNRFLRVYTASTVEFLRPIPSVALIPVAVLLYGTSMASTLLLVVYAAFWQMFVQVVQGTRDVDPVALDTTKVFKARWISVAGQLLLPTVLPYALTGLRLSASIAIILTITGEMIIGTPGIGNLIAVAQTSGATASMYALIVVAGTLGVLVNLGTRLLERRLLFWHPSVRKEGLR